MFQNVIYILYYRTSQFELAILYLFTRYFDIVRTTQLYAFIEGVVTAVSKTLATRINSGENILQHPHIVKRMGFCFVFFCFWVTTMTKMLRKKIVNL